MPNTDDSTIQPVLAQSRLPPGGASPTAQTYDELQRAYDHFNRALFANQLPTCLITLQRDKTSVGFFSPDKFGSLAGAVTDEIAMNPSYFAVVPLVETMQTLVHEMAHLWQHHFGDPGRGRYHNAQWAQKMESIGLMPSSTGQPGGMRTGDRMADYAMVGGRFLKACEDLLTQDFALSWYDRFPAEGHVQAGMASMGMQLGAKVGGGSTPMQNNTVVAELVKTQFAAPQVGSPASANKSNRAKYVCPCGFNVWGKPGLHVLCGVCEEPFVAND